jgi:hypothetical protein
MEQLESPIHPLQGSIAGDDLTQSAAVHVCDFREVDDQFAGSRLDRGIDPFSELGISIQSEIAVKIQNHDIV